MRENVFQTFGRREARGILAPGDAQRIVLTRHPPPDDLAEVLERVWCVRWDLEGLPPREQDVLPFPCVNVAVGAHQPGVHGPITQRFVARIAGRGRTVGLKFRPAGFHALLRADLAPSDLVDRPFPIEQAFAATSEAVELARTIEATDDPDAFVALTTAFLRAHHRGVDDEDRELNRIVAQCQDDSSLSRVGQLAESTGRSVRALERLFRSRIGVSPKWVIRRFRVQEAALRLASGIEVDLSALAQTLGYFDQSHFSHDFRSQVGRTPKQYAAFCAALNNGPCTRSEASSTRLSRG